MTISDSVDGAVLRQRHIERLRRDRTPVTLLKGESALELGERICEAIVPRRPKDAPVLVKPNLCGFDSIKDPEKSHGDDGVAGRVTDPDFLRGVVRCLKKRGHTRVTLAEGCGTSHQRWVHTIEVSGYDAMAREEGVPLVAMDDDGVFDVAGGQPGKPLRITGIEHTRVPTLLMPKILAETLEHGLFISVPKLKAHRFSVVSLGIKGMQGTVMRSDASPAYNQKWRMHAELKDYLHALKSGEPEDRAAYVASLEAFAERMVDVLEISLPDVVLVDGAPSVTGDGFQKLRFLPEKIAIGGTNPVAVDRVGAEWLGLYRNVRLGEQLGGHRTSPLIEVAAKRYGIDLAGVRVVGDGVSLLSQPRPVYFSALAPFTIEGDKVVSRAPAPLSAPVESGAPPTTHSDEAPPTARASRAASAPNIDGRIDEVWAHSTAVTFDRDYTGASTGIATRVRFLWSTEALYALFELSGTGFHVDRTLPVERERPKLYEEDCVEFFLAPDPREPDHYFEIELGPFGHFFDLEVDRKKRLSRTNWSSGVEVKTSTDAGAHTAVIEARFTSSDLTAALVAGRALPLALFRMEGISPRSYLAWRPAHTDKPNFHLPASFGTLSIEE